AAARGEEVAFAEGAPDKSVVAHELAHVVQARQAGGSAAVAAKSTVSRPDQAHEREADDVAAQAARGGRVQVREAPAASLHFKTDYQVAKDLIVDLDDRDSIAAAREKLKDQPELLAKLERAVTAHQARGQIADEGVETDEKESGNFKSVHKVGEGVGLA